MHGFSTVDAINVIRNGRIVNIPSFDTARRAWRIYLEDNIDGTTFVVDVGLACEEDFSDSPRVEIVTAFWRRGRRKEVQEWSDDDDQHEGA